MTLPADTGTKYFASIAVTLLATVLILTGVFSPLVRVPIFSDDTFFDLRPWSAVGLLALAAASIVCVFYRRIGWLLLDAFSSAAIVVYTLFRVHSHQQDVADNLSTHMAAPLRAFGLDLVFSSRLGHGWYLMFAGVMLLLGVALLTPRIALRRKGVAIVTAVDTELSEAPAAPSDRGSTPAPDPS